MCRPIGSLFLRHGMCDFCDVMTCCLPCDIIDIFIGLITIERKNW